MSILAEFLTPMDKWERAAFLPYLFAPLLLTLLLVLLTAVDGGETAFIILIPVVLAGYFTFYQIAKKKFATDSTHYLVSGGMILYTLFFPLLLQDSDILVGNFTVIYLLVILPTFLGHTYSVIYQITANLSNQKKALVIQKVDSGTTKD